MRKGQIPCCPQRRKTLSTNLNSKGNFLNKKKRYYRTDSFFMAFLSEHGARYNIHFVAVWEVRIFSFLLIQISKGIHHLYLLDQNKISACSLNLVRYTPLLLELWTQKYGKKLVITDQNSYNLGTHFSEKLGDNEKKNSTYSAKSIPIRSFLSSIWGVYQSKVLR